MWDSGQKHLRRVVYSNLQQCTGGPRYNKGGDGCKEVITLL